MAACGFGDMMRFGKLTVKSRTSFQGSLHLRRSDAEFGRDGNREAYVRLGLPGPSAKTAAPGEVQFVTITNHQSSELCPIGALVNVKTMVPALAADPLFGWRESKGQIRATDPSHPRLGVG
jgi:hypothetical protein